MASNSIFSSSSGEGRWVDLIIKTLQPEVKINIDTRPCIFHVPSSTSSEKPEAYAPKRIGLGPYHHLRPELYQFEMQKLAAIKQDLRPEHILKFLQLTVRKLKEIEPNIRGCYDKYLDLDGDTLAWILALDGRFLLCHLSSYLQSDHEVDAAARKSAEDIFMLENQIPVIVLKKIEEVAGFFDDNDGGNGNGVGDKDGDKIFMEEPKQNISSALDISEDAEESHLRPMARDWIPSKTWRCYDAICKKHSPLKLASPESFLEFAEDLHLLNFMYNMITSERPTVKLQILKFSLAMDDFKSAIENTSQAMEIVASLSGSETVAAALKHITFLKTLPWEKLHSLFTKISSKFGLKKPDTLDEIEIPSVTELYSIAKVKFNLTDGGIRDVRFDKENLIIWLPAITLNVDSEGVLRNLLAYEALAMAGSSTFILAEYIDLICGIVDTAEDVRLLRQESIIQGELTDQQIADLFNGFRKSTGKHDKKTSIEVAIEGVNKRFDSMRRVKAYKFMKKILGASWKLAKAFWKIFAYITSIILVLLLIVQAFCQVYGCPKHWFGIRDAHQPGLTSVSSFFM